MSDKEVVWSTELDTYEPCTTCLDIAMEAAYSNGFHTEDDEYQIVDEAFDEGEYSDLIPTTNTGWNDQ